VSNRVFWRRRAVAVTVLAVCVVAVVVLINVLGGGSPAKYSASRAGHGAVASAKGKLTVGVPAQRRLIGCTPSGLSEVSGGYGTARAVALTFDDGPWDNPPSIDFVRELARLHAPGTFFEIGRQIPTYDPTGSVERAMLAAGDMIGDHTWSHPDMDALPVAQQKAELLEMINAVKQRTGFRPCLWRPPDGDVDPELVKLARSLGLITVMWDVDTKDWTRPGVAAIVRAALAGAHNGAIIIMHFGGGDRTQTLASLPKEVAGLRARGYKLVTVAQLLGIKLHYS
jgi:peptidoglycan-N-acetylglucosamine deacetylase